MMSTRVGIKSPITPTNRQKLVNNIDHKKLFSNEDNDIEFGYYIHHKKLGEGGFGKVLLATHLKTQQKVAIKIMNKSKLGKDLFRIHIEVNALKALQHENIAKLLQVIETNENIYLVLEYCSGGELFDYLVSKHRLSEKETKLIIRDLANVLSFIHENGFAHRDLKPENLMFDSNHRIKLIDFGLAANCQDFNTNLKHLSTCCGSPAYAAPEVLEGISYSGSEVDVWSAGVLLYTLLVGMLPFESDNIGVLYNKIKKGVYYCPNWLSKEAQDLIKAMLKTDPNERITVNDILSHPWLKVEENKQISTPRVRRLSFDEIFWTCRDLFPNTPVNELKQNILTGFGYQTATYWLIKKNPAIIEALKPSKVSTDLGLIESHNRRRRSKSFDLTSEIEIGPKVIAMKRKIVDCETLKDFQVKKSSPDKKAILSRDSEYKQSSFKPKISSKENSPSRIPVLETPPKSAPNAIDSVKAKYANITPVLYNNIKHKVFKGQNVSNKKYSPFRKFIKSFTPQTPVDETNDTQKKSLLKRLLETATPSKSQSPRILSASTDPTNITLTNFTDPQKCIDKLMQVLKQRGVQCKQKAFSLRCVLSSMNVIILSFNLEICQYDNLCVIQRKRLKGDAWNYKRVCEEILKISNQ